MSYLAMKDIKLEEIADAYFTLRERKREAEEAFDKAKSEFKDAESRMVSALEVAGLEGAELLGHSFRIRPRFGVRLPASEEASRSLQDYLKERGLWEQMNSISSKKLNSWFQAEMDAALEEGQLDFSVPGLEEPTIRVELSVRKK